MHKEAQNLFSARTDKVRWAAEQGHGGKLGIDATAKLPTEGYRREGGWPTPCVLEQSTLELVERRWHEYGIG